MDAIAIRADGDGPRLLDVPAPEPGPGEALVRTLRVGVDGTDHEVIAGRHGGLPPDEEYLILGHEAVGVVADPNGTPLDRGDVVVPTVRRPRPGVSDPRVRRGELDMAPPGAVVERGIDGAHGFMAEYFTSPADCLVRVPDGVAARAVLAEPMSVTEKALEIARAARSTFDWRPEAALVLGNGPLGLVTAAMLVDDHRTYCLGRRDRPDPTVEIIERLGATYVDGRETPVDEVPAAHEPADLVYEATGHAEHAVAAVDALAHNGVAALLGVPGDRAFEVDGGRFHREMVIGNRALVGSVNAGRRHVEAAVDRLEGLPAWLPDALFGRVVPPERHAAAFERDRSVVKAVVEFGSP